ncbi:hypothetical protein C8C83_4845 [Flavobacterium sp. 90]|uniref:hypothetical protein n=1 Tax=unclassified Flavobacterium TaxID=196869 RepID=UPI000EB0672F|nr:MULTISPECIES: hypothetical protein [unclassified Flavobacterium]RKR05495.1 hypothetical protein C8C82_5187 [Flavobacterium sp. 81]TCK56810.1 hypothetical protein C8C83_4845 [Flavobacterium sp. 90]
MKITALLFTVLFVAISCSSHDSDDKPVVYNYYGNWINVVDAKDIDNPYVFRESYKFNRDKTFTKTRIHGNVTTTASGTFEVSANEIGTNLKLTYPTDNMLILNCSNSLIETLTITKAGLLDNDGRMCDAESTYEKTK